MARVFETPRPVPSRLAPVLAGAAVIVLALPVFLVAGWPLAGWALGAMLWLAAQRARSAADAPAARRG